MFSNDISGNAKIFPRVEKKVSFLYLDRGRLAKTNYGLRFYTTSSNMAVYIPVGDINCLVLGPGTSITNAAVRECGKNQCLIIWSGDKGNYYYASGIYPEKASTNLQKQMRCWASKKEHMNVVRAMYQLRFPDAKLQNLSLQQMMGMEGKRVQQSYKDFAEEFQTPWDGRIYRDTDDHIQDSVNRCLMIGNSLFYSIVQAVITTLGYSSAIGFIHNGTMRSFVYDIADLYKKDIVVEPAFRLCSNGIHPSDEEVREEIRRKISEKHIIKQMVSDLDTFFKSDDITNFGDIDIWNTSDSVDFSIRRWSSRESEKK